MYWPIVEPISGSESTAEMHFSIARPATLEVGADKAALRHQSSPDSVNLTGREVRVPAFCWSAFSASPPDRAFQENLPC